MVGEFVEGDVVVALDLAEGLEDFVAYLGLVAAAVFAFCGGSGSWGFGMLLAVSVPVHFSHAGRRPQQLTRVLVF